MNISGNSGEGIALLRPDGSEWRRITKDEGFRYYYGSPSWSPDGHWLVYTRTDSRDIDQLFIMDITGGRVTQLTSDPTYKLSPAWSPDGEWIAYAEEQEQYGQVDIYIVNRYGRERKALANSEFNEGGPAWSPDGNQIAYIYRPVKYENDPSGSDELYVMDADGNNKRKIFHGVSWLSRPTWSPDGEQIAFGSYEDCSLYTVGLDGSHLNRKTYAPWAVSWATWSPDGKYIAFDGYNSGGCAKRSGHISVLNVTTRKVTELVMSCNDCISIALAWSPVPALSNSETYAISAAGNKLSLRSSPSLDAKVLDRMLESDRVTILEGPVDAEDYYWWRMRTADGVEGWAVEVAGWYQLVK